MSKFDALQAEFSKLKDEESAYWVALQDAVKQIKNGFGDYLGLQSKTFFDSTDREYPYIAVGHELGNAFSAIDYARLPRSGKELRFVFKLTLDKSPSTTPPNVLHFRYSISLEDGIYMLTTDGVLGALRVKDGDFTMLYDQFMTEAESQLAYRPR